MDFVCKSNGNTYAVHVTVALVGVATLNLALLAPLPPHSYLLINFDRKETENVHLWFQKYIFSHEKESCPIKLATTKIIYFL